MVKKCQMSWYKRQWEKVFLSCYNSCLTPFFSSLWLQSFLLLLRLLEVSRDNVKEQLEANHNYEKFYGWTFESTNSGISLSVRRPFFLERKKYLLHVQPKKRNFSRMLNTSNVCMCKREQVSENKEKTYVHDEKRSINLSPTRRFQVIRLYAEKRGRKKDTGRSSTWNAYTTCISLWYAWKKWEEMIHRNL